MRARLSQPLRSPGPAPWRQVPAFTLLGALVLPVGARAQTEPDTPAPPAPHAAADSLAPATLAGLPAPRPITLNEAVAMAQRNAPSIIEAHGRTRSSAASNRSALASFLPTLSVSAGASRQIPSGDARTTTQNGQVVILPAEPWSYNTGVGASLQLFDGGRRIFQRQQTAAELDAAEVNEASQLFDVALEAKQQYFNVLAYREAVTAARAEIDQAEQQYRTAVLRVRAGGATRSDSLRSEIQLRNSQLRLTGARNNLIAANAGLTRAVGSAEPVTASAEAAAGLVGLAVTDVDMLRLAQEGPLVQEAKAQLDAARAARRASRSPYLPTVGASWSYGGSAIGDDRLEYNGGLRFSLSYPIFDQLNREEQVVRADVGEANAEAALRNARLLAQEDLARFLGDYRTAEERVLAQTASLSTAEEDLRVQQRRYQVGASTLLDLLASQTQVNQAREALIRARYDQRVAKAQLEALLGRAL